MKTERPGGDDQPSVYSGTLVVAGQGLLRVISTGLNTEMGKIGTVLQTVDRGETRLKSEIDRIVRIYRSDRNSIVYHYCNRLWDNPFELD